MSSPSDLRFSFGRNWLRFSRLIDDDRISAASASLCSMLGLTSLEGLTFLDVGSGSGLFSLAARQLGANVTSFDFDPESVRCTTELREHHYGPGSDEERWVVEEGSVLDEPYMRALGQFDIVYSWGVLHHTGSMWRALDLVTKVVKPGGKLFIALYNDGGKSSDRWWSIKRLYNRHGPAVRSVLVAASGLWIYSGRLFAPAPTPVRGHVADDRPKVTRGMSRLHDLIDWVGGYPYEVATPGDVFDFYTKRGFILRRLVTRPGQSNNEFVFDRPLTLFAPLSTGPSPHEPKTLGTTAP